MDLPSETEVSHYEYLTDVPLNNFFDGVHVVEERTSSLYEEYTQVSEKEYTVVLYMRPQCPYCKKVMNYLNSTGQKIPVKDIGQDPQALQELIQIGGKKQVPCLFINGRPLYESNDIIQWLKANKGTFYTVN